jgi:hypothetical protein
MLSELLGRWVSTSEVVEHPILFGHQMWTDTTPQALAPGYHPSLGSRRPGVYVPMDDAEMLRRTIEETPRDTDPLLAISLSCAVPLWIEKVRGWDKREREAKANAAGHTVAYGAGAADVATAGRERRGKRGTKKKGKAKGTSAKPREGAAEVFNSIACGLAILAYCPGGVTWGGNHWEAP